MADGWKRARLAAVAAALMILCAFLVIETSRSINARPLYLRGAIMQQSATPTGETPIADVGVSVTDGLALGGTTSSFNGFFSIRLLRNVRRNEPITLSFRHPDYQPLDLHDLVEDRLYVVHLIPIQQPVTVQAGPPAQISNVLIRYSIVAASEENIGTTAKMFEVPNIGNVSCRDKHPCSPDGNWKASTASESMDAGDDNEFKNARVSCIAGPCPFTKIDSDQFSQGGRHIKVTVRNWSDTTTFLMQAEVFQPQTDNIVRTAYPVILGSSLNFTLPPTAEGPSIEAEVNGESIIFALGPNPILSWADCNVSVDKNQAKFYRCDLKSEYQFRETK